MASVSNIEFALDICGINWDLCDKFKEDAESEQVQDTVIFGWCIKDVVLFGDVYNEEEYIQ